MYIDLLCPHCGYPHNGDDIHIGCGRCHGNYTVNEGYTVACNYAQSIVQTPEPVTDDFMFTEVPMEQNPMAQRIAALEAQNARLLLFVEALADGSASGLTWGDLRERYQAITDSARALLTELEGGERDG